MLMNITDFATPVVGAVIGYTTNWIAIKMLFRPRKEMRLLGLKIPFTPGLIPKERERIALAMGQVVEKYLLTGEVIRQELTSESVLNSISDMLNKTIDKNGNQAKLSMWMDEKDVEVLIKSTTGKLAKVIEEYLLETSTREQLTQWISKEVKQTLSNSTAKEIFQTHKETIESSLVALCSSELVQDRIKDMIKNLINQDCKISQLMGSEMIEKVNDLVRYNEPRINDAIRELMEDERFSAAVKEMISAFVANKFGAIGAMFANPNSLYNTLKEVVNEKLEEIHVSDLINEKLNEAFEKHIYEIIPDKMFNDIVELLTLKVLQPSIVMSAIDSFASEDNLYTLIEKFTNWDCDERLSVWVSQLLNTGLRQYGDAKKIEMALEPMVREIVNKEYAITPQIKEKIVNKVIEFYKEFVDKHFIGFMQSISLSRIVSEQINSFEDEMLEEMILSITKKELRAITWLGGLLGFLMSIILLIIK